MIVFDRTYNHYLQFAQWTEQKINFVCRLKKNAVYNVAHVLAKTGLENGKPGVISDEHIHLDYKEAKKKEKLCLRKVAYRDEKEGILILLPTILK